jgi:hypothetical protein
VPATGDQFIQRVIFIAILSVCHMLTTDAPEPLLESAVGASSSSINAPDEVSRVPAPESTSQIREGSTR